MKTYIIFILINLAFFTVAFIFYKLTKTNDFSFSAINLKYKDLFYLIPVMFIPVLGFILYIAIIVFTILDLTDGSREFIFKIPEKYNNILNKKL